MENAAGAELAPRLPPGLGDDWVFDRDLACPTCRYNLRMLRTPRCPECGTTFRWQTLLQIGCPRCGESLASVDGDECPRCRLALDWGQLLAEADPERLKLFEYTRRPVRAALRTWVAALRPRRFWQDIRIESPPAVNRLRWLRRAAFGICVVGLGASIWATGPAPSMTELVEWLPVFALVLMLPVVTMVGLPRFTPTLTRFKVRRDQLLRCCAYGSMGVAAIGLLMFLCASVALVANTFWPFTSLAAAARYQDPRFIIYPPLVLESNLFSSRLASSFWFNVALIVGILYFSFVWWWPFLWIALRGYLKLNTRNALALFVSTQSIGLLAILIILIRYSEVGLLVAFALKRIL